MPNILFFLFFFWGGGFFFSRSLSISHSLSLWLIFLCLSLSLSVCLSSPSVFRSSLCAPPGPPFLFCLALVTSRSSDARLAAASVLVKVVLKLKKKKRKNSEEKKRRGEKNWKKEEEAQSSRAVWKSRCRPSLFSRTLLVTLTGFCAGRRKNLVTVSRFGRLEGPRFDSASRSPQSLFKTDLWPMPGHYPSQ